MWKKMTQEEVMNVQVGDKIRVNGVETEVTKLYNRESGDYGFDVSPRILKGGYEVGTIGSPSVEQHFTENVFEKKEEPTMLDQKKIWVEDLSIEQKKHIQDIAFKQGFDWPSGDFSYSHLEVGGYFFKNKSITYVDACEFEFFKKRPCKEMTYHQFCQNFDHSQEVKVNNVEDLASICRDAKCDVTVRQDGIYEIFDNTLDACVEVDSSENLLKTLDKIIQMRKLESEIGYKF